MMQDLQLRLEEMFRGVTTGVVDAIPSILGLVGLLIFAVVLATVAARLLHAVLGRTQFDALVRRSGADRWLRRIGLQSPATVIPRIVFWVLLFLFAREVASTLGLTEISEAIGVVTAYLPKVIAAFLILLVGSALAQITGQAVGSAARDSGMEHATALGRGVTGVILLIIVVMALSQLEIDTELVRDVALVLLAGATLAVALSFGLGSRDVTRNLMAGLYARRVFGVGDEVEVAGHHGVIEAMTPTQTVLRAGDRTVVLANGVFLDSTIHTDRPM